MKYYLPNPKSTLILSILLKWMHRLCSNQRSISPLVGCSPSFLIYLKTLFLNYPLAPAFFPLYEVILDVQTFYNCIPLFMPQIPHFYNGVKVVPTLQSCCEDYYNYNYYYYHVLNLSLNLKSPTGYHIFYFPL